MTIARVLLLLFPATVVAALAAGCATTREPVQIPTETKVQVPVPCVDPAKRPQRPALRTLDQVMAMERGQRTRAAWSELEKREAYVGELEAQVEACSRIPRP